MQDAKAFHESRTEFDQRENDESRLEPTESVHLAGVGLVEVFTPSTISSLHSALDWWESRVRSNGFRWSRKNGAREMLERSRTTTGAGGWSNLGVVLPEGKDPMFDDGFQDPSLPAGVTAVWIGITYLMPSVAIVSATFAINEDAGDLSEILREDFGSQVSDVVLTVPGRLGSIRARFPWSRPRNHGMSHSVNRPRAVKREAADAKCVAYEASVAEWFNRHFAGRFAQLDSDERPVLRMLVTESGTPFADQSPALEAAGLGPFGHIYRSEDGWAVDTRSTPKRRGMRWTVATPRAVHRKDSSDPTNWTLVQEMGTDEVELASAIALMSLIGALETALARLRDSARRRHRLRRPVRDARTLNDYLLTDGLDGATIASDLVRSAASSWFLRLGSQYIEEQTPLGNHPAQPRNLMEGVRRNLAERGQELSQNIEETSANLRASAELQQAIANTRMQRVVLVLTVAAVVLAVLSLVVAAGVS